MSIKTNLLELWHEFSLFRSSILECLHRLIDQQTRLKADAEDEEAGSLEAQSRSHEALVHFSAKDSLVASPSQPPSVPPILPSTSLPKFSHFFQTLNPFFLMLEWLHHLKVLPHFTHFFDVPRCRFALYILVKVLSYLDHKGKLSSASHSTIRL